jgi:hypothetical protein
LYRETAERFSGDLERVKQMAWTKQTLKWNTVDLAKVNGAAKPALNEAAKALELSNAKVNAARAALEPLFDGKTLPQLPAGKVVRLSIRLDSSNNIVVKAAAARQQQRTKRSV